MPPSQSKKFRDRTCASPVVTKAALALDLTMFVPQRDWKSETPLSAISNRSYILLSRLCWNCRTAKFKAGRCPNRLGRLCGPKRKGHVRGPFRGTKEIGSNKRILQYKNGKASCRERVLQCVYHSVGSATIK